MLRVAEEELQHCFFVLEYPILNLNNHLVLDTENSLTVHPYLMDAVDKSPNMEADYHFAGKFYFGPPKMY